jgi:hypothetical protein
MSELFGGNGKKTVEIVKKTGNGVITAGIGDFRHGFSAGLKLNRCL